MQSYDLLIERIASSSGLTKEEIEKRVEARRAKLSGLISREGAAQIIAAELGVNFDNVQLKISELMPGMRKVNIIGKVINIFPVREFNKNGRSGKVSNFIIADETNNIKVVLWDTNHISLVENGVIREDVVVEISNAAMRDSELHLSGFSNIKKSEAIIASVKTERTASERIISEIQAGQNVKVRGVVVQFFAPRFFSVCPECGKKAVQDADGYSCAEHGRVQPKERVLINFVLDDGTENIRSVLFSDQIAKLIPEENLKDPEKLASFREDFLGSEFWISGNVRKNQLFNNLELIGNNVEKVNPDQLIEVLEK